MHNLAPEIISIIFDEACEDYRNSIRESMKYHDECKPRYDKRHLKIKPLVSPITLRKVCRRWKAIADSTQILWDTIQLEPNWSSMAAHTLSKEDRLQAYLDASKPLEKWLHRAGIVPLTIQISAMEEARHVLPRRGFYGVYEATGSFKPASSSIGNICPSPAFCDIAIPYDQSLFSAYWKPYYIEYLITRLDDIMDYFFIEEKLETCTIYLETKKNLPNPLFIPHPPIELLSLREFDFYSCPDDPGLDVTILPDILESLSAPSLQKLTLSGSNNDTTTGSLLKDTIAFLKRSSFPSLCSLTISVDEVAEDELLDLLRIIPALTHLELNSSCGFVPSERAHHDRFIKHDCLTYLKITHRDDRFTRDRVESLSLYIMTCLSLPKLQELDVSLQDLSSYPTDFLELLHDFRPTLLTSLSYSGLRVLTIRISNATLTESFLAFLKSLPDLECLHVMIDSHYVPFDANEREKEYARQSTLGISFMTMLLPPFSDPNSVNRSGEEQVVHLPKLTELTYEGAFSTAGAKEVLIDALEYRWKGDRQCNIERLMSAHIFGHGCGKLEESDISRRIKALMSQGMDLMLA
ncbi:hypothetical protein BDQ17DRAFT_1546683 [Cyathus striatus]|nr:hypothetical protein BDQ17DRAFT_1546683 [Cyathus striatus]